MSQDGETALTPVPVEVHPVFVEGGPGRELARRPAAVAPAWPSPPARAALALGGFVAGAAVMAALRRGGSRGRRRRLDGAHVVSSRSFLVDVHLVHRD